MLRKLPGDTARDLVSTTPDTAIVFRPTVVNTPAIVVIVIALWRFLAGIVHTVWRHPTAVASLLVPAAVAVRYGWTWAGLLVGSVLVLGVVWALLHRVSFLAVAGWRLLAFWRWMWIYRRHWQPVMVIAGLSKVMKGRDYLPVLVRVSCDDFTDRVTVKMLSGQSVEDWAKRTDHLAHAFGALSCRVSIVRAGRLLLTFPRRDPLATPIEALPIPPAVDLGAVPVGKREDGRPWTLKLHGTHVLVAGATGSGKGSIIWSAVRGLLPAVRAGLVQIIGLDPKLMELSYGRELFHRYASSPEECADALEETVALMHDRAGLYAGHQRSHTPSVAYPFVLVVVDEVAFLTAYQTDKHLRERVKAALATLTTQGRAVGVGVLAALQDPRKEVMSIRNLFPDKIALRLDESEQVDMVLGEGARDRGALADQISPIPERGAGVGFVRLETSPDPVRVRAAYVCDADIHAMVAEFASSPALPEVPSEEVA
ncbi:FtsK/SpoIIIE domain-containing protein [Planomonospora corallina]|uniref:FtsK/SpoIIIE domain-containing protein n=1 Tax=Planomonospora corallina TaxID=1806052 RepID=A0ABV8IDR0_9ACTN